MIIHDKNLNIRLKYEIFMENLKYFNDGSYTKE